MILISDITGKNNEYKFVEYLNGKSIEELNPMFYSLIKKLYPVELETARIKCWLNHLNQKSDIFIKINGIMRGISIKKGMKNSVHVERISDFVHFLIENKNSREIVMEYLKYHYADGTINGTGEKRLSAEEYKKSNQEIIDRINKELNNDQILSKAIERFIIKGNNSQYYIAAIICGEVDDFIWITREDIRNIILSKKDKYSTAIHFGTMICQPKNRCLNYNSSYEKERFCVQIKWYSLFDDIIENMNNSVVRDVFNDNFSKLSSANNVADITTQ